MARILVIDDEDQIRRILRRALESEGHEVIEARHGKEGLSLQRIRSADLVITDICMPETDGVDVIAALQRESPRMRVIAISGQSLDVPQAIGVYATLQKPFEIEAMLRTVELALAA